ncbi:MAG: tRNA uridine-5-carboxymethylaminomethyl(34) synthesis GTPase MnmE [Paludibacteraceae bacterium]|nr:tRNA uridine-5-carboxymethylaminomethyl(34) synthesis GTPase MnmE [Paludibacteraceae bacterium]
MFTVQDTICAVSTAPGVGGIAVIRVSGKDAIRIVNDVFVGKEKLVDMKGNTFCVGKIRAEGKDIDQVVVNVFRAPHSFTGEDVVEISCHGSVFIQRRMMEILIECGCRMAKAGEFTQRAFVNGKMDLSQAEAIADLIASKTRAQHDVALKQLKGAMSHELEQLRDQLLQFTSLVELELDFSDQGDVEFADRNQLKALCQEIQEKIATLANSFELGNALKNGVAVALIGETNAGKSTLLNKMVGDDRAIVSDIEGTTRDVIEDEVTLQGVLFRFIDTAGLRETEDKIENMGIDKTYAMMKKASVVVWVIDSRRVTEHLEWLTEHVAHKAENKRLILAFNKQDMLNDDEKNAMEKLFANYNVPKVWLSAKTGNGVEELGNRIVEQSGVLNTEKEDVLVTNARHYEALRNAQKSMRRVRIGLEEDVSGDLLSQDLRETIDHLGEITGKISSQEILNNIFGKFCVGK